MFPGGHKFINREEEHRSFYFESFGIFQLFQLTLKMVHYFHKNLS